MFPFIRQARVYATGSGVLGLRLSRQDNSASMMIPWNDQKGCSNVTFEFPMYHISRELHYS